MAKSYNFEMLYSIGLIAFGISTGIHVNDKGKFVIECEIIHLGFKISQYEPRLGIWR
jgi:hypothetical protein